MKNTSLKIATVLCLATVPLVADVKLNDNFSVSGYVTGSAYSSKDKGQETVSEMEVDSTKLAVLGTFDKVSGMLSFHSFDSYDPVVLDAYVTYDTGSGTTFTFGKFLSYLGYEAFDFPNMLQWSYANDFMSSNYIPAYHSGVRADFSSGAFSGGVAVLDSVYGVNYYEGDHDLNNGAGFEGFLKYDADGTTAFFGLAYDTSGANDQATYDFWLQQVVGKTTLAGEFCYSDIDNAGDGYFWLLLAMQSFDKWSVTGRISGGQDETDSKYMKYTVSPAYVFSDNFSILFEYSYTDYKTADSSNNTLAGQFIFKF